MSEPKEPEVVDLPTEKSDICPFCKKPVFGWEKREVARGWMFDFRHNTKRYHCLEASVSD